MLQTKNPKKKDCYVCGKPGHKAHECFQQKGRGNQKQATNVKAQANLAKDEDIIAADVVEANLVENKTDWMLNTRASRHLYANRELFHQFMDTGEGVRVFHGKLCYCRNTQ